jgi:restriction system protein
MSGKDVQALVEVILTAIPFILFTGLAIWGLNFDFTRSVSALFLVIIGLAAIFVFGWILSANRKSSIEAANLKSRLEEAASLVNRHIETLARRRIQLIRVDAYGISETSKWDAEIQRFVDKVIFPELFAKDFAIGKRTLDPVLRNIVEEKSKSRAIAIEANLSFAKDMTPQDFERWCTKVISSNGWSASITKATGDQGADVIAEKDGTRLVFQCKLYNTPVGNKAVQEAFAAQHHYRAKASAVVTNATFTPSAVALAATTGVLLLHYSDLSRLNVLVTASKTEAN